MLYNISGFRNDRPIPANKVFIQTNIIEYNLYTFCEKNKSKTVKAVKFKQKLKSVHILEVVSNKFSDRSTVLSERLINSNGRKDRPSLVISF